MRALLVEKCGSGRGLARLVAMACSGVGHSVVSRLRPASKHPAKGWTSKHLVRVHTAGGRKGWSTMWMRDARRSLSTVPRVARHMRVFNGSRDPTRRSCMGAYANPERAPVPCSL